MSALILSAGPSEHYRIGATDLPSALEKADHRFSAAVPHWRTCEVAVSKFRLMRENQVAGAFRKARLGSSKSAVAVPFWGRGAVKALGLSQGPPTRVICNLFHPGCNPDVISELRSHGIKVRTNPRLHAKIYATPTAVIVGSSNVSSNGLTAEGAEAKGWIEANVFSSEPTFVREVHDLFETIWADPLTLRVRAIDIRAAQKARADRPSGFSATFRSTTLIAACREEPGAFENVYVAAYSQGLGDNGARLLADLQKGTIAPKEGLTITDFRKAWGYQMEDIREDAWLIDLDCKGIGKAKVWGCAQATGVRLAAGDETDLTIASRRPVTIAGRTFKLSKAEKTSLAAAAVPIADAAKDRLILLSDAIKIMDHSG